jgi:hypothetical protein
MKVRNFIRKPEEVEAVLLTKANLDDVAEWCDFQVDREGKPSIFQYGVDEDRYDAFPGQWIVKDIDEMIFIYTPKTFAERYEPVDVAGKVKFLVLDGEGTVEAVLVTLKNIREAAAWAGANVLTNMDGPFICLFGHEWDEIPVRPGNWLIRELNGDFTGCGHEALLKRFIR